MLFFITFLLFIVCLVLNLPNIIYKIFLLLLFIICCSILLFKIHIEFFGIIIGIIYVGAILILFLFVIIITGKEKPKKIPFFVLFISILFLNIILSELLIPNFNSDIIINYPIIHNLHLDFSKFIDSNQGFNLNHLGKFLYNPDNCFIILILGLIILVSLISSFLILRYKKRNR